MNDRIPISKKMRFEVFKRDKFTCQYCGATAAHKLLHIDHVQPVAEGGKTTLLNLLTACADCNLGKGARLLSDDAVVTSQYTQLAELEERRQQLELMRKWRSELEAHSVTEVDIVVDAITARAGWTHHDDDKGRNDLRRLIKKHGLVEVLSAMDESFDLFFRDGSVDHWDEAFRKIGLVISMRAQEKDDPHIRKILYIQGILRKRFDDSYGNFVDGLKDAVAKNYPLEVLEVRAKRATTWSHFVSLLNDWSNAQARKPGPPEPEPAPDEVEEVDPIHARHDTEMEESENAWHDAAWHIRMWAMAFGNSAAGRWLEVMAGWVGNCGYVHDGKIGDGDISALIGLRAVGLIRPTYQDRFLTRRDDRGNLYPSFQVPPMSPREATAAFNRFGALKIGFWENPRFFAQVEEVH